MPRHEGDGDGDIMGKHGSKAHFHFENDDQCEQERCDRNHEHERGDRDNGATKRDTFSVVLSDGYSNKGNLLDGTILVD